MNPVLLILSSVLMIHPVVEEATPLRLVALGTGNEPVSWSLDGEPLATTQDGEALTIVVEAGSYELRAETLHPDAWEIHARPDPRSAEGATYVQGWSAASQPAAARLDEAGDAPGLGQGRWLWAAALAGLVVALWPARRPKTP